MIAKIMEIPLKSKHMKSNLISKNIKRFGKAYSLFYLVSLGVNQTQGMELVSVSTHINKQALEGSPVDSGYECSFVIDQFNNDNHSSIFLLGQNILTLQHKFIRKCSNETNFISGYRKFLEGYDLENKQTLQRAESEKRSQRLEIENLNGALLGRERENSTIRAQISNLRDANNALMSDVARLRSEIEQRKLELNRQRDLRADLSNTQARLESKEDEIEAARTAIHDGNERRKKFLLDQQERATELAEYDMLCQKSPLSEIERVRMLDLKLKYGL